MSKEDNMTEITIFTGPLVGWYKLEHFLLGRKKKEEKSKNTQKGLHALAHVARSEACHFTRAPNKVTMPAPFL